MWCLFWMEGPKEQECSGGWWALSRRSAWQANTMATKLLVVFGLSQRSETRQDVVSSEIYSVHHCCLERNHLFLLLLMWLLCKYTIWHFDSSSIKNMEVYTSCIQVVHWCTTWKHHLRCLWSIRLLHARYNIVWDLYYRIMLYVCVEVIQLTIKIAKRNLISVKVHNFLVHL